MAALVAQARLGVLPHAQGLYPRLTTREHVRYFAELHGMSGQALDRVHVHRKIYPIII